LIEVKNLTKVYGDCVAVDHLNFHVKKGKIYGFLGPNGAGKTTTMNMITGYIAATEGEIKINGFDIFYEPEKAKKSIGYLPELPPVYMDMTPEEYLRFAAELKGIPKLERKAMVEDVMNMTGVTDMRKRLIKNLSKGYRQRVGLAQALLGYPEILILDEPTVGLDPKQIIEMRELIRSLKKSHTIILSSHILTEISEVCDEVLIITEGKLVASDSLANLSRLSELKNNQLFLTVKGNEKTIVECVRQLRGVKSVKSSASVSDMNAVDLIIERKNDMDIREELFYALANIKCPIISMRADKKTLEDIFIDMTKSAGVSENGEAILESPDSMLHKEEVQ